MSVSQSILSSSRRMNTPKNGQSAASTPPVIGYCRVSSRDQAVSGVSLDAQAAQIAAWAVATGHEPPTIYSDDGISGKDIEKRPGLKQALAHTISQKGVLVVASLSRLTRSTADAIELSNRIGKAGADLVSLKESIDTTSAIGRAFFRIIAAFAEFEREMIVERTQDALDHKRRKHEALGNCPFGFRSSNPGRAASNTPAVLVVDDDEAQALVRLFELRAQGIGWHSIAKRLTNEGFYPRGGYRARWWAGRVKRIHDYYQTDHGVRLLVDFRVRERVEQIRAAAGDSSAGGAVGAMSL